MADKGRLTEKHMQSICKGYGITQALKDKFKTDENGLYYNVRLEEEVLKRCNYTQSRRENAKHMHKHMVEHMPEHMGNGNGNNDIKSFSFTNEEDNQYKQKPSINIKHTINKDNVKPYKPFKKDSSEFSYAPQPPGARVPNEKQTDDYIKKMLKEKE